MPSTSAACREYLHNALCYASNLIDRESDFSRGAAAAGGGEGHSPERPAVHRRPARHASRGPRRLCSERKDPEGARRGYQAYLGLRGVLGVLHTGPEDLDRVKDCAVVRVGVPSPTGGPAEIVGDGASFVVRGRARCRYRSLSPMCA